MFARVPLIAALFALIIGVMPSYAAQHAGSVAGNTTVGVVPQAVPGPGDGAGTLTLLHNNDGESNLLPDTADVGPGAGFSNTMTETLTVGGVAAFKTVVDREVADAQSTGNAVITVYAGDSFLAGSELQCSDPQAATGPVYDAIAQRQIPYTVHVLGNHEFDYTPDFLKRFIDTFGNTQPFLSTNLDFTSEVSYTALLDADGIITDTDGLIDDGRVIGGSAIYTDTTTGQRFGIVGATTPLLSTISSPRNVKSTTTVSETAVAVQAAIDDLYDNQGVRKILLVSHLQGTDNDRELIGLLNRVDIAVAGGGDELLVNDAISDTLELIPGKSPSKDVDGNPLPYPLQESDASGRTVYILSAGDNYNYLGRLDAEFDADGEVASIVAEKSYPRRVITADAAATTVGIADAVAPDAGIVSSVIEPVQACLETLANTNVARTEVQLNVARTSVRGVESNAGNLIADSFLYSYDQNAAGLGLQPRSDTKVIALQNGGGIRQNAGDVLPTTGDISGTITRQNTIDVLPFANFLTVITDVTAPDLKTVFERSAEELPGLGGQFLQVSGINVKYNALKPVGSRVISVTLSDGTPIIRDGEPVADAPSVSVVTNSFTAGGGDDYKAFAANPNKLQLPVSYEQTLVDYLQGDTASFPVIDGLPTILASDPRYQPGGEGRLVVQSRGLYFPLLVRNP